MAVITYLEAIRSAMQEEMQQDDNVFVLGEDVGKAVFSTRPKGCVICLAKNACWTRL